MHNASRIVRVPGTTNRKGSGSTDRPWRRSRDSCLVPDALEVVPTALLTTLATPVAPPAPLQAAAAPTAAQFMAPAPPSAGVDVVGFVARHMPDAIGPKAGRGGDLWVISVCPFNGDHSRGEAYVGRMPSGAAFAGCQHNSCTWGWRELRDRFEPRPNHPGAQQQRENLVALLGPAAPAEGMYDTDDLDVSNDATAAAWLRDAIGKGRLAGLFDRIGLVTFIAREGETGYAPPTREGDHDGPAQVRTTTAAGLAAYIDARYQCFRLVKVGDDFEAKPALFPLQSCNRVIDLPDPSLRPGLRHLAGVVHTPVVRADGSILDAPGYDPATWLYYLPDPGLNVPAVPDQPTVEQLHSAVALLDEMTAGFPWKSDHDRASYLGFLLTPLLRNLAPPPYKLFIFDAPQQGTGKTLLAELGRILHGGVLRGGVPHNDDAETRKVITTVLVRTTGAVVVLDNLTGTLDSPVLAGLLTSPDWADRVLGATEEARAANDRLWCATANNLSVGVDMVRRVVWVGIDAQMARPQDRTRFAIPDLPGWARARRGDLLHALLVLVRAWVAADRPVQPARTSDGFAHWVQVVDGILAHAGVSGRFADPSTEREEISADDDEWGRFLRAAHDAFGEQAWTAKELLALVRTSAILATGQADPFAGPQPSIPLDALPGDLAERALRHAQGAVGVAKPLGMWLSNRNGRFVGPLAARQAGKHRDGAKLWRIVQNSGAMSAGTAGTAGTSQPHPTHARNEPVTVSDDSVQPTPPVSLGSPRSPRSPRTPAAPTGYAPVLPRFPQRPSACPVAPVAPVVDYCRACGMTQPRHTRSCPTAKGAAA